jgi:DNA mismatch endonuclease (patch repair protein)
MMPLMQKKGEDSDYLRDGRAPVPVLESTSKVMRANKGKDTSPEMSLRKALWHSNLKGYRLNVKQLPGRPDIVYPRKHLAIFVHGCFWHRCPMCNLPLPKAHKDFWLEKFRRNVERDGTKTRKLEELSWKVLTVWECEIKEDVNSVVDHITELLDHQDRGSQL